MSKRNKASEFFNGIVNQMIIYGVDGILSDVGKFMDVGKFLATLFLV